MFLFNCYIPEYQGGVLSRFEPRAPRKLLLKRSRSATLIGAITRQGLTLVPLQIHFNDRGRRQGAARGRPKAATRPTSARRSPRATGSATRPG